MKATELRIGNIVWLVSKSKEWEILSGQEIDTGCDSNDFKPIPLTEEWLVRFGFVKHGNGFLLSISDYGYHLEYRDWGRDWAVGIIYYDPSRDCDVDEVYNFNGYGSIEYVHQIQNLIFALTGEELEMKKW